MIVVGIDERPSAEDALGLARWLAAARAEELLLAWIHPYEQLPSLLSDGTEAEAVRQSIEAMAERVRAAVPDGFRPQLRLVSGRSAAHGLGELAEREQASLVVLGASERTGLGRLIPGSTARRLLSGSPVPVALASRGWRGEQLRDPVIGVGFDGGAEAAKALEWAARLTRDVGGRLLLVAVQQPIAFSNVSAGTFPVESVGEALRRQLRLDVETAVAGLTPDLAVETRLTEGDPVIELTAASAELELLVLGSRGYGPVRSVLLGSVSEAVVGDSAAPVVLIPR
jgi:nucleotide-binding universal stress UspA family protein